MEVTPKQIWSWVIAILGAGGVFSLLFWGVPYYIDAQVDTKFDAKVEAFLKQIDENSTDPASAPVVVTLAADMETMKAGQARIERKVDTFSASFMEYLEREANR